MNRTNCLATLFVLSISVSTYCRAETQFSFRQGYALNEYILKAYEKIKSNNQRVKRGYDKDSYYTIERISYGSANIEGKNSPLTMCNAATTELIIEAINEYATIERDASVYQKLSASDWNARKPYDLKMQTFMVDFSTFDTYKKYSKLPSFSKLIELEAKGVVPALEKLGLGSTLSSAELADLLPGDIITFDRSTGGGHSAIFLGFLDRNQKVISKSTKESKAEFSSRILGFKYFSSQLSLAGEQGPEKGGLDERWAYFEGWCPYSTAFSSLKCKDAFDQTNSPVVDAQPRDCCVYRTGKYAPRAGYVLHPSKWRFSTQHSAQKQKYEKIMDALGEELKQKGLF